MKKVFPKKMKRNDLVVIISPSQSASLIKKKVLRLAQKNLKQKLDLSFCFSENAFKENILGSSSVKFRINDIHGAFLNPKIKGIICSRGGYNINTLLKNIDWEVIRKNPKPILGNSDITVFLNAIFAKTGVVTYLGPNFWNLGVESGIDYMMEYFEKCLMSESSYEIIHSKEYGERGVLFRKNSGPRIIQEGTTTGTIIGGHMSSLNLLQGTEFMPSLKNSLLFLETDKFGGEDSTFEFERDLQSLLNLASAKGIRGLILGRFQKDSKMTMQKLKSILLSKEELKNIPIVSNVDFGHTIPNFTIPIGGRAYLFAFNNKIKIEILKH